MAKKEVHVLVGTRKGGFVFRSDLRRKNWKVEGPFFPSGEVTHLTLDPRTGKMWAALQSAWWGTDIQVSANGGKRWQKACRGVEFAKDRNINLARVWQIVPDRDSRPGTLWCGVDPGTMFRTDDGGKNWYEIRSLTEHATRDKFRPGGGGLMVHAIVPDPSRPQRVSIGISVAGFFRSDDDGATWTPFNRGVRADFQPEKFPEVGVCVHRLVMSPQNPDWLFQQNHCGVYRSRNGGEKWTDVSRGLPSRFGFPMTIAPNAPQTIYVATAIDAQHRYCCNARLGVFRSRDGGDSWQELRRGLPQKNVYTLVLRHGLAADACEATGVYVGTSSGEIFYSRDGGDSWDLLHAHLPAVLSVEAFVS